jgi:lipopolysaccharide export system protein LptA
MKSLQRVVLSALLLVAGLVAAKAQDGGPLAGFGSSNEPVQVESARLEVVDKEQKAVYSGDVVVTQGETRLRCSRLTVYYTQAATTGAAKPNPDAASTGSGIRKLECEGPLSAVNGNSTVTGDRGTFDGESQVAKVIGNVILTDCENIQRGDLMVYNLKSGVATVSGGRVTGIFSQSGNSSAGTGCR